MSISSSSSVKTHSRKELSDRITALETVIIEFMSKTDTRISTLEETANANIRVNSESSTHRGECEGAREWSQYDEMKAKYDVLMASVVKKYIGVDMLAPGGFYIRAMNGEGLGKLIDKNASFESANSGMNDDQIPTRIFGFDEKTKIFSKLNEEDLIEAFEVGSSPDWGSLFEKFYIVDETIPPIKSRKIGRGWGILYYDGRKWSCDRQNKEKQIRDILQAFFKECCNQYEILITHDDYGHIFTDEDDEEENDNIEEASRNEADSSQGSSQMRKRNRDAEMTRIVNIRDSLSKEIQMKKIVKEIKDLVSGGFD